MRRRMIPSLAHGPRLAAAAVSALALAWAQAPDLSAQEATAPPDGVVAQIQSVRVLDTGSGTEVRILSDGSLEQVGTRLYGDSGLVVLLPWHRPGPGVGDQLVESQLVSEVQVLRDDEAYGPMSRVLIRTRARINYTVVPREGVLRIQIRRVDAEPLDPLAEAELTRELGSARTRTGEMEREVERLRRSLAEAGGDRDALSRRADALAAQNALLDERLVTLESRRLTLEAELRGSLQEIQRLAAGRAGGELEARLAAVQAEADRLARDKTDLRTRLLEAEASLAVARAAGDGSGSGDPARRLAEVELARGELTERLDRLAGERDELAREIEILAASNRVLAADLADAERRLEVPGVAVQPDQETALQIAALEDERRRLETELAEARQQQDKRAVKESTRRKIQDLEAANRRLEAELDAARDGAEQSRKQSAGRQETLARELEGSQGKVRELTARVEALEGDRASLETELAAARGEVTRLGEQAEARVAEMGRRAGSAADREEELQARLSALEEEERSLSATVQSLEGEGQRLESELAEARQRIAALGEEAETRRAELARAAEERDRLEARFTKARQEADRQWAREATKLRLQELETSHQSMADELAGLRQENARLETELGRRQDVNGLLRTAEGRERELHRRVDELESELARSRAEAQQLASVANQGLLAGEEVLPRATTSERVSMRSGPGMDFERFAVLPAGLQVRVLQREGEWVLVRAGAEQGWVFETFLAEEE